jgi:squalene monooxygenase
MQRQTVGFTVGLELRNARVPAPTWGNIILGAWGPVLVYPIARGTPTATSTYRVTLDLPANLPAKGARLAEFLLETFVPFLPHPLADQIAEAIVERTRAPSRWPRPSTCPRRPPVAARASR